jgi:hypothetical protein
MFNKGQLYDTFNAKYLSFQEVANSFIVNDEYQQLLVNSHTLLMGPRGCGKTTLLKMLTPAALDFWPSPAASQIKDEIPFTAVYIPTDIQWKSQLQYLERHLGNNQDFNEKISEFLILTNVQVQLCRTFESLIRIRDLATSNKLILEEEICKELINTWEIEKPVAGTLANIELSLLKRVDSINRHISRAIYLNGQENLFEGMPDYVFSNFLPTISRACQIFENSGILRTNRWALCFDELEIAPKFFQNKLYTLLRSSDPKFLFKLTTTPLVSVDEDVLASQDNDFRAVRLWVFDESGLVKWEKFCDKLIQDRILRQLKSNIIAPKDVFGEYNINEIIRAELQIKGNPPDGAFSGSFDNLLFKSMAERDQTFRQFLLSRKIDPNNPVAKNNIDNKSIFLKHRVKVLYRHIFKDRTRKVPAVHFGTPHIYDLCDGNPRSVIGLVDEMLLFLNRDSAEKQNISFNKQSEIIQNVSKKYFNLIKNHPNSTILVRNKQYNVALDLLRKIGNYIYRRIVKDDFDKSTPTTFTVDTEIDHKILILLEHALHLGAIIYLDPIESLSKTGLVNKRFRLSYLLSPLFRIPNRVDGQANLATILREEDKADQNEFDF